MGPITAQTARRIAADGTWRRLLTEPHTGRLLDISVHTHDPPQDLTDYVLLRDRTCRSPGCHQPAERADLDHVIPWPKGPTSAANLCTQCRRHHNQKTLTDTRIRTDPAGGHWRTLPSGKSYYNPPTPVLDHPALLDPHRSPPSAGASSAGPPVGAPPGHGQETSSSKNLDIPPF